MGGDGASLHNNGARSIPPAAPHRNPARSEGKHRG